MSIDLEEPLASDIRAAARAAGQPVSVWLAEAAQAKLRSGETEAALRERRSVALGQFLDEYQAEHGAFTDEEIKAAELRLGYHQHRSGAA